MLTEKVNLVKVIICLLWSDMVWPKVIPFSGSYWIICRNIRKFYYVTWKAITQCRILEWYFLIEDNKDNSEKERFRYKSWEDRLRKCQHQSIYRSFKTNIFKFFITSSFSLLGNCPSLLLNIILNAEMNFLND